MLAKEKLDVKRKNRSNLFNWRGQFTPQFVEYILNEFAEPGNVIVDPFAGSGTVLQESARKNLNVYGLEINPAAYAMSKFFTFCNLEYDRRIDLLNNIANIIGRTITNYRTLPVSRNGQHNNFRESNINLISFAKELLNECKESEFKIIALNILFKVEKLKKLSIIEATRKSYSQIKQTLLDLCFTNTKVAAYLADARNSHKILPEKADLVITSPPYINVFNYHQNYRSIMELLQFNLLNVAESEFGSNRKNRGNRFKTVIQYCLDIEATLHSIWESLNVGGKVVMIVGRESNVRRVPFYNGKIVHQIIANSDGFNILNNEERAFNNKFGNKIIEDILIFEKNEKTKNHTMIGRTIAKQNLSTALEYANGNIKQDIIGAINNLEKVSTSPMFNIKHGMMSE